MKFRSSLDLELGPGIRVSVDLSQVPMSNRQRVILTKLLARLEDSEIDLREAASAETCDEGRCLASRFLEAEEFNEIRGLKAVVGDAELAASFIICDFCMKCVELPY